MKKIVLAAAAAALLATPALGQQWPAKQVTLIVPFTAGGTTDQFARILGQAMQQKYNGTAFIVENRAGAGGTVGAAAAARAPKDGYTLFVGTGSTQAISPWIYRNLPYDPDKDFQPVSLIATLPNILVINNNIPAKNMAEFIAYAKANAGKLAYGSSGIGASNHIPAEIFADLVKSPMTHVPYRSSNEIMTALTGGHIQLAFDNITLALPQIQAGTIRAIAVTSKDRSPNLPDIPAIAETFAGFDIGAWHGVFAPAGTPKEIVDKVSADIKEIFSRPDIVAKLKEIGAVASPMSPEQFTAFSRAERARYKEIVEKAKIPPQQ